MNGSQRMPAILFLAAALIVVFAIFVFAGYSFAETRVAQVAAQPDASPASSGPLDTVKADYDAAERVDSLEGWDVFLAQHPTGDYTARAQERRAKAVAKLAALPSSTTPSNDKSGSLSQNAPAARSGRSYLGTIECAAKFQAAKLTGKLNGRKWDDFRTAECGPQAVRASGEAAPVPNSASAPVAPPPPAVDAVFPPAVDPKYAKDFSDKGRMRTCADQFNVNKAVNANGGMKWIDKGGGYYAECNRRLKGA
jgi:hypothetical protein